MWKKEALLRLSASPMPLVPSSSYRPPWWMCGGHMQTIIPALFRKAPRVTDRQERLELADGDFLDLEWGGESRERLAILCHGLEADAGAAYIQSMAQALVNDGWAVLAWNYRGCSGEMNRLPRFYHSGASEDLSEVIAHALAVHPAQKIDLVGFSLGGNMILKFLGERGDVPVRVHRAVTFSVPCDLACSSVTLESFWNRSVYMRRFIRSLAGKVHSKHAMFPEHFDLSQLDGARTFRDFDDRFTAPLHGFRDAEDYWKRSSSRQFLGAITVPSLLVNAANDPFLGPGCYPRPEAEASSCFHLEVPASGGHVGFSGISKSLGWAERRAMKFLTAS